MSNLPKINNTYCSTPQCKNRSASTQRKRLKSSAIPTQKLPIQNSDVGVQLVAKNKSQVRVAEKSRCSQEIRRQSRVQSNEVSENTEIEQPSSEEETNAAEVLLERQGCVNEEIIGGEGCQISLSLQPAQEVTLLNAVQTDADLNAFTGIADRLSQPAFQSAAVDLVQVSKVEPEAPPTFGFIDVAPPTELDFAPVADVDPLQAHHIKQELPDSGEPEYTPMEAGVDPSHYVRGDQDTTSSSPASGGFVFCPVIGMPYVQASCKQEPHETSDEASGCEDAPGEVGAGDSTRCSPRRAGPALEERGSVRYTCDACGEELGSRLAMRRHARIHGRSDAKLDSVQTTANEERPYACDVCPSTFVHNYGLNKHKKIHTRQRTYCCDACPARFTSGSHLARHVRSHTGEKPYSCDICRARFAQSYSLTIHRRVHTGVKPYACDRCPARFTQSCSLTTHYRTHTGEKPYACVRCDARFAQVSSLIDHGRSHAGVKAFACDRCDERFTRGTSLVKHVRSLHAGVKPFACDR